MAFVGGLLIGDLGSSPKTETVYVATSSNEGEEAEAPEPTSEATEAEKETGGGATGGNSQIEAGAQVFAGDGCGSCHTFKAANSTGTIGPDLNEYLAPDDGKAEIEEMIVDPGAEIAEGYPANVMPQNYGRSLASEELQQLVDFLYVNSPAGEGKQPKPASGPAASGPPGTLKLAASPSALAFDTTSLTTKAGKVAIDFENPAPLEHNVKIEQNGKEIGGTKTIRESSTTATVQLSPGTYTFYCSIPGHREAGMEGTLVVK
jgi:plastocyanin/cytochrome c551/c552